MVKIQAIASVISDIFAQPRGAASIRLSPDEAGIETTAILIYNSNKHLDKREDGIDKQIVQRSLSLLTKHLDRIGESILSVAETTHDGDYSWAMIVDDRTYDSEDDKEGDEIGAEEFGRMLQDFHQQAIAKAKSASRKSSKK